jgi:hypothetical protein
VERVNEDLADHERIKRFELVSTEWTPRERPVDALDEEETS